MKIGKSYCALGCAVLLTVSLARAGVADDPASAPTGTAGSGYGVAEERKLDENKAELAPPLPTVPADISSGVTGTAKKPDALEPLFVRPLMKVEAGRNDSNPTWSPRGTLIAFERSMGDKREVRITLTDGTPVQTVSHLLSGGGGMTFFFPGVVEEISYNAGITWSPEEDRFVFMSNGGEGNYELYLQDLGGTVATRLTDHKEKDGQPRWSPVSDRVVFVSGRTGNGDVYLMDLPKRVLTRLTRGGRAYLYPQWSPDGGKLVMMHGSNENHDILLISDVARPAETRKALTTWASDDLRPAWSPDGKKIAFYSNYNAANDLRQWAILVIAADGSDPTEGDGLAAKVVATDVLPDVEAGPAWLPDSSGLVFVKNDRQEYNPLSMADLRRKTVMPIKTDTRMNHDVSISVDGTIAFRAQVDQWDQIYVMKLKN